MNAGVGTKSGAVQYSTGMETRSGNGRHIQENTQSWFCCMFYIMNPQPVPSWSALSLLRWRKVSILSGASSIPDHTMQQDLRAFWHHWEKNESSLLKVLSAFLFLCSLRSLVWTLRCMFCLGSTWGVFKRSKLSVSLTISGKWKWMGGCCSLSETSWVPPWGGLWMGTASVCLVFA